MFLYLGLQTQGLDGPYGEEVKILLSPGQSLCSLSHYQDNEVFDAPKYLMNCVECESSAYRLQETQFRSKRNGTPAVELRPFDRSQSWA